VQRLDHGHSNLSRADDEDLHRASLAGAAGPLGLVLDAHGLRDPVDVVEERDDLDRVVDGRVREAGGAQAVDRGGVDRGRVVRQRDREVAKRAAAGVELRVSIVVGGVSR
jgi:hypothetical protein